MLRSLEQYRFHIVPSAATANHRLVGWYGRRIIVMSVLLGILKVMSGFLPCERSLAAAEVSLLEIRSALDKYARTIETLEGRQHAVFRHVASKRPDGSTLLMEDATADTDFKVDLILGHTRLASARTWYHREISAEPFAVEQVDSFDGDRYYHLLRTLSRSPVPSKLPLNAPYRLTIDSTNGIPGHQAIWRLAGLSYSGSMSSLAAVVNSAEARITGRRTLDNRECVNVAATEGAWRFEASLDPSVNWLPRRFASFAATSTPTVEQRVSEFKQFPVGSCGELVWFPVLGRQIDSGTITVELELTGLQINNPLSKSEFQIDPSTLPDGVLLVTPNGTTYSGNRKDLWDEMDKLMDEDTAVMRAIIEKSREIPTNSVNEAPTHVEPKPGGTLLLIVLGVITLLVAAVGIRLAWKRA